MEYKYIQVKTALNKVSGSFPYDYDLNIYRGCEHGCQYCYAIYSHHYLEKANFFECVYIKENIIEVLEAQLSKPSWKKDMINIGSVCDSYQPIEAKTKLMRQVLKLMIKYQNPITISTKSLLILRDIDLLSQLANLCHVNIAFTITSPSNKLNRLIEPNVADYLHRFAAIKKLKQTNAQLGLHIMPIIPYISANKDYLEKLFQLANTCQVDYVLLGMLNLKGATKQHFFEFIKQNMPIFYHDLHQYYHQPIIKKAFLKNYYAMLRPLLKQYQISSRYIKPNTEKEAELTLF